MACLSHPQEFETLRLSLAEACGSNLRQIGLLVLAQEESLPHAFTRYK